MTYWVYKLTYDRGTAPHVAGGLLSLAICKPRIREDATEGDLLFGFSGRSRKVNRGERLIYVAKVTRKLSTPGAYYERPEYRSRWDCIYQREGERLVWRPGSLTHQEEQCRARDLGPAPRYPRAIVLLSDDFRYLGAEGTMEHAGRWPNLAAYLYEVGIGERPIAPESGIGRMLTELKEDLWRTRSAASTGAPTEPFEGGPSWGSEPGGPASAGSCAPRSRPPRAPRGPAGRCG